MFFYKYISYLINPLPVILGLLVVGFLCRKHKKWQRVANILTLGLFLLVSTPFLPRAMLYALENTYPVFNPAHLQTPTEDTLQQPVHIMVLGAGHGFEERFPPTNQLNTTTLGRLVEGVRIYQSLPNARLVLSAGTVHQPFTQADIAARAALALGVSAEDTLQLNTALNTAQEAASYKARFGLGMHPLILVSNASHLPRAMYLFAEQGVNAIPAPTNHKIRKSYGFNLLSYFPSTGSISMTEKAWHEYLGLWYAKLRTVGK